MTIRLALVGCGNADVYLTVPLRMPDVEFVAAVDTDPKTAKAAAALGATITAPTVEELLAKKGGAFDAVVIHGYGGGAARSAIAAAAAGKHVLAPSAMAQSAGEARLVVEACATAGVALMAGSAKRFDPCGAVVKNSIPKLGDPGLLRIHAWGSGGATTEDLLLRQAIDSLDLATWIFGSRPSEIYATGSPGYAQIHMGFNGGGMALIDHTSTLPEGGSYYSLSLIGSTGAAYADDHRNRELLFTGGAPRAVETTQGDFAYIEQLREFIMAVKEKRSPAATGEDGVIALEVAEGAANSLAARAPLHWKGGAYAT